MGLSDTPLRPVQILSLFTYPKSSPENFTRAQLCTPRAL